MAGNGNGNEILVQGDKHQQQNGGDQVSGQLRDQVAHLLTSRNPQEMNRIASAVENCFLPEMHINVGDPTPSQQDIQKAEGKVDGQIDGLLSDQQKQTLKGMQDAILSGDPKAFGNAISQFKGNPEELKKYVDEVNKNLKASGADERAAVDASGNVVVYGEGNKAVEVGPDGTTRVRAIEHLPDGTIVMKDGEVLNGDPSKVMKGLGNDAVNDINEPRIHIGGGFPPDVWPRPGHPFDPGMDPGYNRPGRPWFKDPGFSPRREFPIGIGDPGFSRPDIKIDLKREQDQPFPLDNPYFL